MAMILTEEEKKALETLENNHEAVVVCPRCGKILEFKGTENSYRIKCPTEGCLKRTIRGL